MESPLDTKNTHLEPVLIEDELKESFLEYAMSVVVSRALPDVRDGLKPVHRRVLYAMDQQNFYYNRPYHKSVRVVGDVLGKYHPHGDQAVYNTMVGMVQVFSRRYPILDGQGNWGSVDGDNAAAMRYTEVRMAKIANEMLADLDKETVPFVPNFDESTVEPTVLPSKIPNLLVNGISGIAVGMATSVPPHNLTEIINGCLALLKTPEITDEELFELIPGPDFPTGGIICGHRGIKAGYATGRSTFIVRGVVQIEEPEKGNPRIIITELPYQVVKADLITKIAEHVRNKVIEGITNIRDESDKRGMRVVIDIKRGETPQVILNLLYKHTNLQTSQSMLMIALLENRPLLFTLRELIRQFLLHREKVIFKRTKFDLKKAQAREHILEGFIVALEVIEEVIQHIKSSSSAEEAIIKLNKHYSLSEPQSKAILEMRLQRLTAMEQDKIRNEINSIRETITFLKGILDDKELLLSEVEKELVAIRDEYGDARRTRIEGPIDIFSEADLIPDEEVVMTLTRKGYIKRVPLEVYGVQHRGGRGKMGMAHLDESEDVVQDIFATKNHDELLFFTNQGRVYSLKVYEVPEASRIAKGRAIVNLLPLQPEEKVVKLLCARDLEDKNIVMVTQKGTIKRTDAMSFAKIRATGIRALSINEGDDLVFCTLSSGTDTIVLGTKDGNGIRFKEDEVRVMGRQAAGVRGIRLRSGDEVVGMAIIPEGMDGNLLFVTENGYGKQVRVSDFRVAHRGGYGVRTIPTTGRNGSVIGFDFIDADSSILLIEEAGKIIRLSPKEIRTMGRQARGVRLIKLDKGERLSAMVVVPKEDDNETPSASGSGGAHTGASADEAIESEEGALRFKDDKQKDADTIQAASLDTDEPVVHDEREFVMTDSDESADTFDN